MMRKGTQSHAISGVFVFLLLGIFAVLSTVMVLMAAKAYRGTVDRSENNNRSRIASNYIRTMLRADDQAEVLRIEELEGVQTITMLNDYDGEGYVTRLYVYDGQLREWFSATDLEFSPQNGETVCAAEAMRAEFTDGLLTVFITENGTETEINFAPRAASDNGGEE